jgi:azurin
MRFPPNGTLQLRRELLVSLLLAPLCLTACARRAASPQPVALLVESNGDLLEFKPKELTCQSGAQVRLTFHHTGKYVSFEHNWVLLRPHTYDAVLTAALAAGEGNHWLPRSDPNILAATAMCAKGQSAVIAFIAPAAGDYLFICTSPGHAQSMWGILHVMAA